MLEVTNDDKILLKTKAAYGLGALGKDFACSIVYIFLMFYYTDVAGISAAFVGTLFLVVRMIDAVTDPMMGMIVDNTRSRFGKFRPWIVIGTVINSGALVALFYAHEMDGSTIYVYAAITYIVWSVTYTIMDIPYWSMIPALSCKRIEREKLVVWPRLFASFAWMVMGAYGLAAVAFLGNDNRGDGFFYLTIIIVASFIVSALITFFFVIEKVQTEAQTERFSFGDAWGVLAGNDQLKSLIGCVLTFNIATQLVGGFAIYYFTYAIGRPDLFPMFALVSGAAEMAGVFVFPWLCNLFPRKFMWYVASLFPLLCSAVLFLGSVLAPENAILVGVAGAALKFGGGIANGLSTVMLADVVDYGQLKNGKRSESIIFSVQTMLVKFAGALAGFFVGIGLSLVGYVPNVDQTESTILGLRFLMIGLPVTFMVASVWIYSATYRLYGELQAEVEAYVTDELATTG